MNRQLVRRIANAVLYEGYILYPYRPSVKNRQRWTFGGLHPESFCRAHPGADAWSNHTECLVVGNRDTTIDAAVRFLHLTYRLVGELEAPLAEWPTGAAPPFRPVEALRVGAALFQTWQEAEEREVAVSGIELAKLSHGPRRTGFDCAGRRWLEPLHEAAGAVVGILIRQQQAVQGEVETSAIQVADGLFRLSVRVVNRTAFEDGGKRSRDEALLRSLISTHVVLSVRGGEFVSLLDPPHPWRGHAADCRNVGVWPVLVGDGGDKDTMLASPIILYDYPQIAPESPGDLFDSGEIDEILSLRILTLTEEEKRAMAGVDPRARALLERTEALTGAQLMGLHGTMRGLRPLSEEGAHA